MDKQALLVRIEQLRKELESVATQKKHFTRSRSLLKISQELDELLVTYSRLIKKEKEDETEEIKE